MRKGRDGENGKWKKWGKKENNGENSGPLTSLSVFHVTETDCNAECQFYKIDRERDMIPYAINIKWVGKLKI